MRYLYFEGKLWPLTQEADQPDLTDYSWGWREIPTTSGASYPPDSKTNDK